MMKTIARQNRRKRHVPNYYEDDVVEYTHRGKVKIPKKYEYCGINGHKYKSFPNPTTARIALEKKLTDNRKYYRININDYGFEVFHCRKCGMYHIITQSVKRKIIEENECN